MSTGAAGVSRTRSCGTALSLGAGIKRGLRVSGSYYFAENNQAESIPLHNRLPPALKGKMFFALLGIVMLISFRVMEL